MDAIIILMLEKWTSFVDQRTDLPSSIQKEMRSFQKLYERITALIIAAMKRNHEMDSWLRNVREVANDADKVLDELLYKRIIPHQHQTDANIAQVLTVPNYSFLFRRKLSHKIKRINQTLEEMLWNAGYQKEIFPQLDDYTSPVLQQHHELLTTFDNRSKIIGREDDTQRLIDLLLRPQPSSSSSSTSVNAVPVISIFGKKGAGKTTLAKLVYTNNLVRRHFELAAWVSASHWFSIFDILANILECITSEIHSNCCSYEDEWIPKLREILGGRKFLLVIDDFVGFSSTEWCDVLIHALSTVNRKESRILVTAPCYEGYAADFPYSLKGLSDEDCWIILEQYAFSAGGALNTPEMVEIGKDLARKCHGLPGAAKYLGILLHQQKDELSWLAWRDRKDISSASVFRDIIIPGMMCQYDTLPLKLKRCFSYFTAFSWNQKIEREHLIRSWIAEGFIDLSDETNESTMEDIGIQFFNDLLGSQLFDDVYINESGIEKDESGYVKSFYLHSITNQLEFARSVAPYYDRRDLRRAVGIQVHKRRILREHMRILELRNCKVENLPYISKKIHLRYLDLSDCQNVSFGQSISRLWYLQTLILRGCGSLTELPRNIGSLKNLRHLDLSYTGITFLPDSSTNLPSLQELNLSNSQLQWLAFDFGALEQLRHLDISATNIKELPNSIQNLCKLRTFKFDCCRFLEVLPSEFGNFTHLKCLDVSGTRIKELPESIISGSCNLDTLKLGHCKLPQDIGHLKRLKHFMFEGDKYETPDGISQLTCLQTLQQFVVRKNNESNGGGIGDLEDLNLLKGKIKICKLENVQDRQDAERANLKGKPHLRCLDLHWSLRSSNVGSSSNDGLVLDALQPHPDLEALKIKNFMGSKAPHWMGDSLSTYLPKLEELVLSECSQWQQLPALGQLPRLKFLTIHGMDSVKGLGNELYEPECSTSKKEQTVPFPTLIELTLENMENLEAWDVPQTTLASFPLLRSLTISSCSKLKLVRTPFPSLKELKLQSCQLLGDLPDIQCLKGLQAFTATNCKELKLSPDALTHIFSTAQVEIHTPIYAF